MIPPQHSRVVAESELEEASPFALRNAIKLEWIPDALQLRLAMIQPRTGVTFHLGGQFEDYKEFPPRWEFWDPNWASAGPFPKPDNSPLGSIFHQNRVICAPFNRLAYATLHQDWTNLNQWMATAIHYVQAHTICEMLSVLWRDFRRTEGSM